MNSTNETPISQPTPVDTRSLISLPLSKKSAHALLDAQRAGVWNHPILVTQALWLTGDLSTGVEYDPR
jgi:hypothetical protein